MNETILVLLQLLLAHILTDFVLQPTSWILHKRKHKIKSVYLLLHALIAGALTYIFLQKWEMWWIPLLIFVSHYLIDLWKLNIGKDDLTYFLLDQFFHFVIIILAWIYLVHAFGEIELFFEKIINSPRILILVIGYLTLTFPVGFLVGKATKQWQDDLEKNEIEEASLKSAGRYIGIFERILVLTFILTNNFSAIGFLIAAKSILRFNEKSGKNSRKQTEYVLIGTLMSFAISILIGLLIRKCFFQ